MDSKAARTANSAVASFRSSFTMGAPLFAAVAMFSYFRSWVVFVLSGEGSGTMAMNGLSLTREAGGSMPWQLIIPFLLLAVLGVSSRLLLGRATTFKSSYGLVLILLGVIAGLWPMAGVARVSRTLFRLQSIGATSLGFTFWWWIYCLSILIIVVSGVLQLAARKQSPAPVLRP